MCQICVYDVQLRMGDAFWLGTVPVEPYLKRLCFEHAPCASKPHFISYRAGCPFNPRHFPPPSFPLCLYPRAEMARHPDTRPYGLGVSHEHHGVFCLSAILSRSGNVHHEYASIQAGGFRFRRMEFPTVDRMLAHFKLNPTPPDGIGGMGGGMGGGDRQQKVPPPPQQQRMPLAQALHQQNVPPPPMQLQQQGFVWGGGRPPFQPPAINVYGGGGPGPGMPAGGGWGGPSGPGGGSGPGGWGGGHPGMSVAPAPYSGMGPGQGHAGGGMPPQYQQQQQHFQHVPPPPQQQPGYQQR